MILVDTSVWIDYFNGIKNRETDLLDTLLTVSDEQPVLTGVILTEILQGVQDPERVSVMEKELTALPVLEPDTPATYLKSANLFRDCRKKGKTIRSTIDCLIAAIALEKNCAVLQRDRDFVAISEIHPLKLF